MQEVLLKVPNEILLETRSSMADFEAYARKRLAIDLYVEKGISLGYCADFAGMTKEDFIFWLAENKVSIFRLKTKRSFWRSMRMRKVILGSKERMPIKGKRAA